MKPTNIKEARTLIDTYNNMSRYKVKKVLDNDNPNQSFKDNNTTYLCKALTGYSDPDTCTLCLAVGYVCSKCIYGYTHDCVNHTNTDTYDAIGKSTNTAELLRAFKARAKHIEGILTRKEW